jgi:hypothetical protein
MTFSRLYVCMLNVVRKMDIIRGDGAGLMQGFA